MSKSKKQSRSVKKQSSIEQAPARSPPEMEIVLQSLQHCITILSKREKWNDAHNETYLKEVHNSLTQHVLEHFYKFAHEEQILVMGKNLVDKGFPKLIFELYECVVGKLAQDQNSDETVNVYKTIREIVWNFSDSCPSFSKAIAETGLFAYLIEDLSNIKRDVLEEDSDQFIFKSAVAILHNCARNPDTDRSIYRDVKAVDHLLPFLKSKLPRIQMVALLALAEMIDDKECDKIQGGENVFKFLRDMINEARESQDRRKEGFCVSELIDGLSGLAKADKNKTIIMETRPLGIFCKVLEDGYEKELLSVCKVVRELAFDQSNIVKIKIRDCLVERNYAVWLDLDFMHVYTLEAMAQAVEKAFVVLMCYSERYKLSPNCRLEAEYAFQQKKTIIPLKMQSGYNPDGWLGILIRSNIYYEFSGTHNFEDTFEKLYNAIEQLPENPKNVGVSMGSPVTPSGRPSRIPNTVEQWTVEEVDQWLRKNKLDPTRLDKLKSMTGEELLFLKTLSTKAPEFFFRFLDKKLGLSNLRDFMNFSRALERLTVK
ncbi:hypothetical protein ACJMK2_009431 [Sinanodonta woodiana]|uniref:TIR domain-containing protein n=1 Tax=Sinanodonta woodiana TaxID=1069815 RepID=A0ABD3VCA1_SINWO